MGGLVREKKGGGGGEYVEEGRAQLVCMQF
jgi:hypothetical protein